MSSIKFNSADSKHIIDFVLQKVLCEQLLSGPAFHSCKDLLATDSFIKACAMDMRHCNGSSAACLCPTMSEYSRQCAHAGGKPQQWKTAQLCGKNRQKENKLKTKFQIHQLFTLLTIDTVHYGVFLKMPVFTITFEETAIKADF